MAKLITRIRLLLKMVQVKTNTSWNAHAGSVICSTSHYYKPIKKQFLSDP